MRGRETAANDLARRLVLVALGMTFFALAALMWPAQADAQIACEPPGCRPLCVAGFDADSNQTVPLYLLTTVNTGAGSGTLGVTAQNPYAGATYNSPENKDRECAKDPDTDGVWDVKHWCTFHCEHRHYQVDPGGLPQPATAWITPTASSGSYFLGWTSDSNCRPPAGLGRSKLTCVQRMDANKTVTANFSVAEDTDPPSAATIAFESSTRDAVRLSITTAATDTIWRGGYEVLVNDVLRSRVGPDATSFAVGSLLCDKLYRIRLVAFDSKNETPSNEVSAKTNACVKVPPNGYFHVKPARRTRDKTAFFHWGAKRNGVELGPRTFKSRCKVDRRKWTRCSAVTGKTVRRLKPGWHTFRVKVGDAQGWDRTPAVWRWRVRR